MSNYPALHTLIIKSFNLEELATLCFNLQEKADNIPGKTLDSKAREFIEYMDRRNRLGELLEALRKERSEVEWPTLRELTAIKTSINDDDSNVEDGKTTVVMPPAIKENDSTLNEKSYREPSNFDKLTNFLLSHWKKAVTVLMGLIAIIFILWQIIPHNTLFSLLSSKSSSEEQFTEQQVNEGMFEIGEVFKGEYERLRTMENVDLGLATSGVERVTSKLDEEGERQRFEHGVIYTFGYKTYAIYGAIYEYYIALDLEDMDLEDGKKSYFPSSEITYDSDKQVYSMEFEKVSETSGNSEILASPVGTVWLEGWIRSSYYNEYGGYNGWLGFPVTDPQSDGQSIIQVFEHGYIVYTEPTINGERDYDQPPVAYPYFGSSGKTVIVMPDNPWQDTNIDIESGTEISIVQLAGEWENVGGTLFYDANGDISASLQEDALLPSFPIGMLIGRIGDTSAAFPVGRWSNIMAQDSGRLYLSINDTEFEDNTGFIIVEITTKLPEQ